MSADLLTGTPLSVEVDDAVDERVSKLAKGYMSLIQSITAPAWAAGFKVVTSRCETCHRSFTLRHLSAQKAGIRMNDSWYCSSPCFTSAAMEVFSLLLTSRLEQSSHLSRMPLGLILISRGWLTSVQLRKALEELRKSGGDIGEVLVRNGSVSEKQVTAARAVQWGCPVYAAPQHLVPTKIQIPFTLVEANSAVPLHYVPAKKLLLVGFVRGIEYGLLYAIERMTGCKAQPCFVTASDFQCQRHQREHLKEQCGDASPNELKLEGVKTAEEMARVLCSYGVELEANEAIIGRCKDYIWARLKCGPKDVDILFKTG